MKEKECILELYDDIENTINLMLTKILEKKEGDNFCPSEIIFDDFVINDQTNSLMFVPL